MSKSQLKITNFSKILIHIFEQAKLLIHIFEQAKLLIHIFEQAKLLRVPLGIGHCHCLEGHLKLRFQSLYWVNLNC